MLYKGDKGVINAAHLPESGPTEVGGLSASSLGEGKFWIQPAVLCLKIDILRILHVAEELYIYIYIYIYSTGGGDLISGRVIPKTQEWYFMLPCLTFSITKFRSMVSGAIQGKE